MEDYCCIENLAYFRNCFKWQSVKQTSTLAISSVSSAIFTISSLCDFAVQFIFVFRQITKGKGDPKLSSLDNTHAKQCGSDHTAERIQRAGRTGSEPFMLGMLAVLWTASSNRTEQVRTATSNSRISGLKMQAKRALRHLFWIVLEAGQKHDNHLTENAAQTRWIDATHQRIPCFATNRRMRAGTKKTDKAIEECLSLRSCCRINSWAKFTQSARYPHPETSAC